MRYIVFLFLIVPFLGRSQLKGVVRELGTDQSLYGIKITSDSGEKTISDLDGNFTLVVISYPVWLYFT